MTILFLTFTHTGGDGVAGVGGGKGLDSLWDSRTSDWVPVGQTCDLFYHSANEDVVIQGRFLCSHTCRDLEPDVP